jgi:hypothetical protein
MEPCLTGQHRGKQARGCGPQNPVAWPNCGEKLKKKLNKIISQKIRKKINNKGQQQD